jgi:hypothetical protein
VRHWDVRATEISNYQFAMHPGEYEVHGPDVKVVKEKEDTAIPPTSTASREIVAK